MFEEGKYAMVKNIARESDIPTHFLAKILQQLARKGFLRSSKGPTGGFTLRRPADEINLLELVDAIDGLSEYQRCPAGMAECNDEAQCGMHEAWKELRSRIHGIFGGHVDPGRGTSGAEKESPGGREERRSRASLPREKSEGRPSSGGRKNGSYWFPWWSSRPPGASGRLTSIRACSKRTSYFSGLRSTINVANLVIAQILFLAAEDPEKDISLYINSPGGSITAGLAILDTMRLVEPDIVTYCVGQAASMAAVLLACGTKGKRYSLPHSRILIHQPSMSGLAGQAADIDIHAREILRMRETLNQILAEATGQDPEKVSRDVDRDYIMDPEQALAYGMIDRIISSREAVTLPVG